MDASKLPGYTYGTAAVDPAPISWDEFEQLKACVAFGPDDVQALGEAGRELAPHVDAILDIWLNPVLETPFLARYYGSPTGVVDRAYYQAVRARFGQWIIDTCTRPYDQDWLNYQVEIGRRHHRSKKNQTDGAATTGHIPLRFMIAVIYPVTAAVKPFLARSGRDAAAVERMHQAWFKSVCLQVSIWCHPYAQAGDY